MDPKLLPRKFAISDYKPLELGLTRKLINIIHKAYLLWFVLIIFCIRTYKEFWFSVISFVLPSWKKNLTSEVSVVVGSASGIGKDLALGLAKCKSVVVCIDLLAPEVEATSKKINCSDGKAFYYQCDVTDKNQVDETIKTITKDVGNITMLFHCCSLPSNSVETSKLSMIKHTLNVSVTSYFYLLESILPLMKVKRNGHIIFLKSVAALSDTNQLPLSVSQFAVQGLYESLVEQLRSSALTSYIKTTLVHIYPCIAENNSKDRKLVEPGFFGSIKSEKAAAAIIDGVRKNKAEISIPKYYWLGSQILKIYPRGATLLLRDFWESVISSLN